MNLKNLKEPFVIILVGPPLSGKSTWIRKNFSDIDVDIISRDEIVLELGGDDYNKAFNTVNQKEVDRLLTNKFINANKNKRNAIVDMTHMTSKRRRMNLEYFSDDYYKLCVIFPFISDEDYEKRNKKRIAEENKDIPMHIVKRMLSQYQPVNKEEGFDKVISIN